jgi:UDP-2-acetamido-3-amino-2,3-dideoxy-glucuronate N-acetyltransferase
MSVADDPFPGVRIHESAVVDSPCEIGEGTAIWHFSHVLAGARIGRNCSLGQNVSVAGSVVIGDGCKIQNNVSLYDGVLLEDLVFCGPSMVFTNVTHPRAFVTRKEEFAPTRIRRGASLGANCTIVCGNEVGAYAFVAAGAVVHRDVPAHALMVGTPARRIGWACRCGESLPKDPGEVSCDRCSSRYVIHENELEIVRYVYGVSDGDAE